jgi:hypothetical protein
VSAHGYLCPHRSEYGYAHAPEKILLSGNAGNPFLINYLGLMGRPLLALKMHLPLVPAVSSDSCRSKKYNAEKLSPARRQRAEEVFDPREI